MSVAAHAALLIVVVFFVPAGPRGLPLEQERRAAVVVARRDADDQVRYFDDSDEREKEQAERAALAPAGGVSALPPEDGMPDSPQPEIALPARVEDVGAATDSLLPGVTLNPSRRRWSLPDADAAAILAEEAARRRGAGPSGPATRVSLFGGSPAEGRTFVFLIDRSKSMGGAGLGALAAAQRELTSALSHLSPDHRFLVIAYNQQCEHLRGARTLVPATDENKQAVAQFLSGLAALDGTGHFLALQMGLGLKPDVVFLLTDGADPHLNESQLTQIRKLAAGRTSIHCVQFGFGPLQEADNFMMRLASQNNGGYQYVRTNP
jgi:hypothetical protein